MNDAGKVSLPVTIARLPEEAITELDERVVELWRDEGGDYETEEYITDDMMSTFNLLTIGYDAAWTEAGRLSKALSEAQQTIVRLDRFAGSVESIMDRARAALSDDDKFGYQSGLKDILAYCRTAFGEGAKES
jgi:hypothetical protein